MNKFYICALGCKVNSYEIDAIKDDLISQGLTLSTETEADIVIVNTCSVTNMADSKSRKLIRAARRENAGALLVACGCMCQNHQEKLSDLNIDILIGNNDKSKI